MRNLFPIHQENIALFNCLFLNNLPRELRILLSKAGIGCLSQPVHHPPHKHSHNGGGGGGRYLSPGAGRRGGP